MSEITVRTFNYVPSFRGKHNSTRCKAWLLLYDRYLGKKRGLKLRELALLTGISYKSLAVLLSRWIRWNYIGFRSRPRGREYSLRKRGRAWLDRWQPIMPLERYLAELENIQRGDKSDDGNQRRNA